MIIAFAIFYMFIFCIFFKTIFGCKEPITSPKPFAYYYITLESCEDIFQVKFSIISNPWILPYERKRLFEAMKTIDENIQFHKQCLSKQEVSE
jgi:hypothetical protein